MSSEPPSGSAGGAPRRAVRWAVTGFWLRTELRRRWRPLLVLALLVALATGTVLAAVAGARRTATAVDRLLAVTLPATAEVSPQQPLFDWDAVRALPGVAAVSTFAPYTGFGVDEVPGDTEGRYLPVDDQAMRTVERPVLLAGRLLDPTRPDEAVVTQRFVDRSGYGVGDVVTLRLFAPDQVDNGVSGVPVAVPPRPDGPTQPVRIVGVVRSLWLGDGPDGPGRLFPSPALAAAHPGSVQGSAGLGPVNAMVRLDDGAAGLGRFRAELDRIVAAAPDLAPDEPDAVGAIDVADRAAAVDRVRGISAFQAGFLLQFAVAGLLAAAVLVGQAIARHGAATEADLRVLGALGMSRRQALVCAATGPALAGVLGAALGAGLAVAVSGLLPFGAAADVEPDPGVRVDPLVLVPGALLVALAVAAAALGGAALRLRRRSPADRPFEAAGRTRPGVATRLTTAAGLPVPVVLGARFALEPGRGDRRTPVRPALAAAVAGVLGAAAALTFAAGVADAGTSPDRFGQTYDLTIGYGYGGRDIFDPAPVNAAVLADPDVTELHDLLFAVAGTDRGTVVLHTGDVRSTVVTTGRAAERPGELVLGPATARQLGVAIGDEVAFRADAGAAALRVVGLGLLPQTSYNGYDSGGWLHRADYDRLFTGFLNHWALLQLRPGADPVAVAAQVDAAGIAAGSLGQMFPDVPAVPDRMAGVRDIRVLPLALGAFLALLGAGAVGHALLTAVRQRTPDLAVLRALGMTRRQTRAVLLTQGLVTALVALLVGLPLGLALGRTLWRLVAETVPLQHVQPGAAPALLAVAAGAVAVTTVLAAWAGHRAVRLRVGRALRAE